MPPRVKGCRNCSRRRISCDRNKPHCNKCIRDRLECYGLEGVYRWVEVSRHGKPEKKKSLVSSTTAQGGSSADNKVTMIEPQCPMSITSSIERLTLMQPDWWVINYFAEQLSPWTCPVLRQDNDCRAHVLPLAASSQLVFDSIAATTYHRLAYYDNHEFEAKGERYKASAINRLLVSCHDVLSLKADPESQLYCISALLILMYDEMIAAHDYFITLVRIIATVQGFIDFSTLAGGAPLHRHLHDQLSMYILPCFPPHDLSNPLTVDAHSMTLFSLFQLESADSQQLLPSILRFLDEFEREGFADDNRPSFLARSWRKMLTIWQLQQNRHFEVDVRAELEQLRDEIETNDMVLQFDHFMTWVYFTAALASPDENLRSYFTQRLSKQAFTFGWKNVALMQGLLGEFQIAEPKWPSRLQAHKEYLCA